MEKEDEFGKRGSLISPIAIMSANDSCSRVMLQLELEVNMNKENGSGWLRAKAGQEHEARQAAERIRQADNFRP